MTTRSSLAQNKRATRPNSAVYIGSDPLQFPSTTSSGSPYSSVVSSPPSIPDLPEPPSPIPSSPTSVTSQNSGLPSPPATNSTGSNGGSQGDFGSVALRERERDRGKSMLNEGNIKAFHAAFSDRHNNRYSKADPNDDNDDTRRDNADDAYDDEEVEDEDGNDEDDTARLDRKIAMSENALALERAKSLAQRNRATIDRLSSLSSRLSTPSPNPRTTTSPPAHPQSNHKTLRHADRSYASGSETEREDKDFLYPVNSNSHSNSSHGSTRSPNSNANSTTSSILLNRSTTPVSQTSSQRRLRLISAPASPGKALRQVGTVGRAAELERTRSIAFTTTSPSSRAGKRVSIAMSDSDVFRHSDLNDGESRRSISPDGYVRNDTSTGSISRARGSILRDAGRSSPTSTNPRRRQPLPREFRDSTEPGRDEEGSISRRGSVNGREYSRTSPSKRLSHQNSRLSTGSSVSSRATGRTSLNSRYADDLSSVASSSRRDVEDDIDIGSRTGVGRRQSLRGGSAESAINGNVATANGRSLLGLGLRAAGLSRRGTVTAFSTISRDRERTADVFTNEGDTDHLPRHPRAATALADYQRRRQSMADEDDDGEGPEPRTAPPNLRTYKSAYQLSSPHDRDRDHELERSESSLSRYSHSPLSGGATARQSHAEHPYPTAIRRGTTPVNHGTHLNSHSPLPPLPANVTQSEHARLMLESLTTFESQLSRITQFHTSSSSSRTAGEMLRNVQGVVYACERLNLLLKANTNRALEEQIECEVNMPSDLNSRQGEHIDEPAEIWRRVGSELREGLRVSDDLVRCVTGLLLGAGRAVRELSAAASTASSTSGDNSHGRSVSLDEDGIRLSRNQGNRMSPEHTGGSNGSGGQERSSSRLSWEYRDREKEREDALRRLSGRDSSLGIGRAPSALDSKVVGGRNITPSSLATSGSMRRIPTTYTPASSSRMVSSASQETVQGNHEPSPTPASRSTARNTRTEKESPNATLGRSRTLPPLSIPKPIGTLPSESRRLQNMSTPASKPTTAGGASVERAKTTGSASRRRTSLSNTVRGPVFSALAGSSGATTAITPHTVSASPADERLAFPSLTRGDSTGVGARSKNSGDSGVTFSRSRAGSAIQSLRNRTVSNVTDEGDNGIFENGNGEIKKAPSGSETERERPRISLDSRSVRASLDGATKDSSVAATERDVHPADRSAVILNASRMGIGGSAGKERRKTVVDVWPPR